MSQDLRIEDGDILVVDMPTRRLIMAAMSLWGEGSAFPATDRERAVWYQPRTSSTYERVDSLSAIPPYESLP